MNSKYEKMLLETEAENIKVIDYDFSSNELKGLYCDGYIGIKRNMSTNEKACILAEELDHYYTSVGNILDQKDINNQKQEKVARKWAVNKLLTPYDLIDACKSGCEYLSDVAEYLNVTVDFLLEAIQIFSAKYGTVCNFGQYVINFSDAGYHVNVIESSNA